MGEDAGYIELTDINGKGPYIYKAHHLHMHSPAEHKINGEQHDLEMHIVHELVDGPDKDNYREQLAVVGIILKASEESHPFVQKLRAEDLGDIDNINFKELFGTLSGVGKGFYHYKGSLTTPPCTDIVNWNVYSEVLPISSQHLKHFVGCWHDHNHGHGNFRECQPLHGRKVVRNFL
jgi:carbonic anhydrase